MRLALCQIDPTVGDFAGNVGKVLAAYRRAVERGADVAICPEMCLTGYPPRDLLERPSFVEAAATALGRILPEVGATALLLGTVETNPATSGRPLFNVAKLLHRGQAVGTHAKCLLPTYDVFDEGRYFEPGPGAVPIQALGRSWGVTVCEDVWCDSGRPGARRLYRRDPVSDLAAAGACSVVNIAASPRHLGKEAVREELLSRLAARHGIPVVMVNQVGGNDELVFDGRSLAFGPDGTLLARGAAFEEDLLFVDLDRQEGDRREECGASEESLWKALVLGTRDYVAKCEFREAVVGLSGGIDSSLVAVLAAEALGAERVLGVSMPSRHTSDMSREDARELASRLGIRFLEIPIEGVFCGFLSTLAATFAGRPPDAAEENLQARIRGTLLMALSNKFGSLVLSTGNKSELAVGYCTLYGDMCGGLAVVSDVPKTLIYALARWRNARSPVIPERVLVRPPTAELRPDQRDTDSLPPYEELDPILAAYVEETIPAEAIGGPRALEVTRRVDASEYKRAQAAPGLKVTTKAFGMGRRYPIARR
ncbi:MAG: NAD+ synthase [Planctomycetes bacterium]|nr:NAD+ synthase [Planctomycetota bacterium]